MEAPDEFSLSQSSTETEEQPCAQEASSVPDLTLTANIPAKYKSIVSNVVLNPSGPPAVCQLKTQEEKTGTLTRITAGEKNPKKLNKTILLVGETGAGKSTLINALLNHSMGVKWEDEVWFQIVEDEKKKSQTESQTSDVIVYEIFGFKDETLPFSLTIIDTPGFGDTRGIEHDDIIIQRLFQLFGSRDGVRELHAVGLVMKASENRVSDRLRYIFDSMMSLFGKNMEGSIVALITHSDGVTPENALKALDAANIKCAKNEKNQPVYFLFNNQQNKERTEENEIGLENAWRVTQRGMKQFSAFMQKATPENLKETVEVIDERIRLTACIESLQERIKETELKQTETKQIQEALEKNKEKMKKNENFTIETDGTYKEKENIDGGMWGLFFYSGAVCCNVCQHTCHHPCSVAWYPKDCKVIERGRCLVCPGKCPVSDHVKEKWKYVTKTKKVKTTLEEVKKKYDKNKSECENKTSLLENLEKEMERLTAEKSQLLDQSYQHFIKLEQIALKADSRSTIVHLDFLIEKMKEEGDTEKVQKLEEMRSRMDEKSRSGLRGMLAKIPRVGELL